jgi:hypothetical protein
MGFALRPAARVSASRFRLAQFCARRLSPARREWAVAISLIIPTAILAVIAWQLSRFWSHRFHPYSTFVMLSTVMPDVATLMLIGTVPDYVQGFIKLFWVLRDAKPRPSASPTISGEALATHQQ